VCALLAVLAAEDGGYFPRAWGWSAIGLAALAAIAGLLRERTDLGRLDLTALAALGALVGWIALSAVWSDEPSASIHEAERGLVYLAGLLAFLLAADRRSSGSLLVAALTAFAGVAGYGLLDRLFAGHPVTPDPFEGTLLFEPLGYANALGIVAAIGLLLATAYAAALDDGRLAALAAAVTPPIAAVLYLTQSRGAWLAVGAGFAIAVLLDSHRVRLVAASAVVAAPALVAAWLARSFDALRDPAATAGAVSRDGHRLFLALVVLAAVSAAANRLATGPVESLVRRRSFPLVAVATLAAAAVTVVVVGAASSPDFAGDRPAYWRVAWQEAKGSPVLGTGAGTFARQWERERPIDVDVQDAHSLYLETLAEVGPAGLALLAAALAVPLVAAVRARRRPLAGAAAGAYVAYLVHAGLDWDWEMPAVTLGALLVGAALLAAARPDRSRPITAPLRVALVGAALVVGLLALAGLLDNLGSAV